MEKSKKQHELPSGWEVMPLGDVVTEMKSGLSRELSTEDIGLPVIRSNNLLNNSVDYSNIKYWYKVDNQGANTENYFLSEGDILVNFINSIAQIGKCAYFKNILKRPVIFTTNLMVVRLNNSLIDSKYFLYFTLINQYQKFIDSITKPAINQASFTTKDYKKLLIPLPPLPEQRAIANILSTWDTAISLTQNLIAQKEQEKKWLMQELLSGKKRLKGFGGDWMEVKLSDIFERVTRKNTEGNTTVVTISAQRGFVRQTDFFNKNIASEITNNYFLVKKGEFCYNKSYSNGYPWGATKRLNDFEKAVVTTLYICFGIKDLKQSSGEYFEQFFGANHLDKGLTKIAHEGGRAHGLLNVTPSDFFNIKINVPSFEEQTAIANVLQTADKEIALLKTKLEQQKLQKKGLMQVLLTGKLRVPQFER